MVVALAVRVITWIFDSVIGAQRGDGADPLMADLLTPPDNQNAVTPPSTASECPVVNAAPSLHR